LHLSSGVVHQPFMSEVRKEDFLQLSIWGLVQIGQLFSERLLCQAFTGADGFPFLFRADVVHDGVGTPTFDDATASHRLISPFLCVSAPRPRSRSCESGQPETASSARTARTESANNTPETCQYAGLSRWGSLPPPAETAAVLLPPGGELAVEVGENASRGFTVRCLSTCDETISP